MKQSLSLIALIAAVPALAEDTRAMEAHEHGVGTLNVAIDGATIGMEFEAPGADIVGFEYKATSDADLAAIDAAIATLSAPLDLFVLPDAAACTVVDANAELEGADGHSDHDGHDHDEHGDEDSEDHDDHADEDHEDHAEEGHGDHDDHGDEDHEDHDHDDHADEDHDGHDDHGHDDHEDHADDADDAGHSEFHAAYTLTCGNPDEVTEIEFAYFAAFPNAQEVEVQIITASGAQAFEVERDTPVLDLER